MAGREGDYISDLDFVLARIVTDTLSPEPEKAVKEEPVMKPGLPVAVAAAVAPTIKKDTTYMVVHEVTQELVTVGEDGFAIQLGAFRKRSNAEALSKKLEASLGRTSEIVVENGLYKVRITGMKERSEVEETIAKLQAGGFNELWIISIKAQKQQWVLIDRQDTIAEIRETIIPVEAGVVTPEMSIQAGAFRRKELADAQQEKLSKLISKPVVIIQEDGYHKVRITGFNSREEIDAMIPLLGKLGVTDIWVPPVRMPDVVQPPALVIPDTVAKKPVIAVPVQAEKTDSLKIAAVADTIVIKPEIIVPPVPVVIDTARAVTDTAAVKVEEKPEVKPIAEEPAEEIVPPVVKPKISLHVGEFRKRSQALRAQQKVESKFGRPVEIFIRWDSYHIVITGFETREETFPFYPELAEMGYTNIYVMQEKQ
jgi:cell division protein FtsN